MKLLRITAEGLPLFKEKLDLSFYAQQRVTEEQKNILYPLFANIWVNSAIGFIGINASGKTSVLKVILLALEIINNEPINHIETRDILGNSKEVKLNMEFHDTNDFIAETKDNEYFVLGDNREASKDSRILGNFTKDKIIGKVNIRFYPLDRIGKVK